ncbi:MAG: glycosyltransferase [Fulvivirga sp.]
MNLIHILSNVSQINYGLWNVVVSNTLAVDQPNVNSVIISLKEEPSPMSELKQVDAQLKFIKPKDVIAHISNFELGNTIVITHGTWTKTTFLGYKAKKKGYHWVSYPHGMLEPWSMKNKRLKKFFYFHLIEKKYLSAADGIVAVGKPEYHNLLDLNFNNKIIHIPNGIKPVLNSGKIFEKVRYIFMARLHYKKGVCALVEAWVNSKLNNDLNFELVVAGPDEGELVKIKSLVKNSSNIKLVGAVYGREKEKFLLSSHFYVLPSLSEGFPSSIIESMTHGCIPIITKGCNFPEIMSADFTYEISHDNEVIKKKLELTSEITSEKIVSLSRAAKEYVDSQFAIKQIVAKQLTFYRSLLN